MAKQSIVLVRCSLNMRQDVLDLLDAESEIRRNEPRGRSQTLNQIILEYFENRTPQNVAVKFIPNPKLENEGDALELPGTKPCLTIDFNPARGEPL